MTGIFFEKKHLKSLIETTGRAICLTEVNGGFHLQISVPRLADPYILHAQRNHPRLFRSLDRAAALLQGLGVTEFTVKLRQLTKQADLILEDDSEIPF
jgi:hypothetical protein